MLWTIPRERFKQLGAANLCGTREMSGRTLLSQKRADDVGSFFVAAADTRVRTSQPSTLVLGSYSELRANRVERAKPLERLTMRLNQVAREVLQDCIEAVGLPKLRA